MKNLFKTFCILFILTKASIAQERNTAYSNLLNQFLYNPALAGSTENIQTVFNLKSLSGNMINGGRNYNFGIYSPIKNDLAVGAKVLSVSSGVFQTINAEAIINKSIKLDLKSNINFGLSFGFTQANIKSELLNNMVDLSDYTLNNTELNRTRFTSGAGISYKYSNAFEFNLAMPCLMTGDKPINTFTVINSAYNIYTGTKKEWRIKPMLNHYQISRNVSLTDFLSSVMWNETITIGGGYRTNGSIVILTGLNFKSVGVNYAFYTNSGNMKQVSPVENEISFLFAFNRPQNKKVVSEQIISDEIAKINLRLNELTAIEQNNPGLIDMKNELSRLNKNLSKVLSNYKITNSDQIDRIKSLQKTIDTLIAKYND